MKKRLNIVACLCVLLAIAATFTLKSGLVKATPSQATTPTNCGAWNIIPSANPPTDNTFNAIASTSTTDAWGVGFYSHGASVFRTFIEHWNGTQWSVISSPNVGSSFNVLNGIAAISPSDAWAVGYYDDLQGNSFTLAEHWNGAQWSVVKTPNLGPNFNVLLGITAISSNDVWAVGETDASTKAALIEHWNGSSWSIVASPQNGGLLSSVSALAKNDVWAVGNANSNTGKRITLVEHWNGAQWSQVASPNNGQKDNYFNSVTALASNNVWAVGVYVNKNTKQTLTEHWNGSSWSIVASPNVGTFDNLLSSVAASASTIWTVGFYITNKTNHFQALIEQWNGSSWNVVASPKPHSGGSNRLSSVSVIPGSNMAWSAGFQEIPSKDNLSQTLTEFHC